MKKKRFFALHRRLIPLCVEEHVRKRKGLEIPKLSTKSTCIQCFDTEMHKIGKYPTMSLSIAACQQHFLLTIFHKLLVLLYLMYAIFCIPSLLTLLHKSKAWTDFKPSRNYVSDWSFKYEDMQTSMLLWWSKPLSCRFMPPMKYRSPKY